MSKVYRFHGPADHPIQDKPELLRKRKKGTPKKLHLIGVDDGTFTDTNGMRPIADYQLAPGMRSITLTKRESDLIALSNPGIQSPVALEDLHPWLPEQRFLNDSTASFKVLTLIIHRFEHHLVSASEYCDEKWNTICNAVRQTSMLDGRFYTAWHLPIQDVHVLEERRPERSVVSIDFNGMYPACMQHPFPKPSSLKLVHLDRLINKSEVLACGLYRCIIEGPSTDFINRFNPFRSFHSGRHLRAKIDEPIEVDLNEFEVEFYSRHFHRIYLVEAVISDKAISHPLAKEVRRSFAKRRNYLNQNNKALADREKYLATLMASCAHRPLRPRRMFESRVHAMNKLKAYYGIVLPKDEPEVAADIWLAGRKGIMLAAKDGVTFVEGPAMRGGSACFLLGQRIVARGRIILLEMMERIINSAPGVEICYTNIDSIHFSLPTEKLESVLAWLRSECSDALGSFKIESVTQHGLWLEPGRYWLYSDSVEKFRNRSVGDQKQPFKDHAIHVVHRKIGELHVPIRATLRMATTMSPLRSLTTDADTGLIRHQLIESGNTTTVDEVLEALEQNFRLFGPMRMAAFEDLRERMSSSRFAATKREDDTHIM